MCFNVENRLFNGFLPCTQVHGRGIDVVCVDHTRNITHIHVITSHYDYQEQLSNISRSRLFRFNCLKIVLFNDDDDIEKLILKIAA